MIGCTCGGTCGLDGRRHHTYRTRRIRPDSRLDRVLKASDPAAGQYILARASDDEAAPLARALFPSALAPDHFQTSGLPPHWIPGTSIHLRGPLGRGFELPLPRAAWRWPAWGRAGPACVR